MSSPISSSSPCRVLVVEDEPSIAENIDYCLRTEGFEVTIVGTGEEAIEALALVAPGFVILDVGLPGISGFDVCREIRHHSSVPVLFLTAREDEIDRVVGLELGADDYVVKPFSPRELVARVKAVLRRTKPAPIKEERMLTHGPICMDLEKRRLSVDNQPVSLTPHEYALMEALMASPGRTFTRDELLDRLYPMGEAVVIDRVVDVHIGKLRQKIEPIPAEPRYIITARGIGYRFADRQPQ